MELALSIYAALVGTAAFGWGVYQWVRGRRPDVLVVPGASSGGSGEMLQMTVVNRGPHPIRIESYSFRQAKADDDRPHQVWFGDDLDSIPPSDAAVLEVPLYGLVDWTTGQELVAEVRLTTGDRFRSKPYMPPF